MTAMNVNRTFQYAFSVAQTVLFGLLLLVDACAEIAQPNYEYRPATRDGIGKYYFGREISHVMGHRGARWLERRSRKDSERTDLLLEMLPLKTDSVVADIGAGTGYFSIPIAKRVPDGRVLAVDIQPEMLQIIQSRAEEAGISNVTLVKGLTDDPKLPQNAVDLILLVDAYHEFEFPYEMARGMHASLKPGGQVMLVEYRAEDPNVPIKKLHKMSLAQATREWEAAGFRLKSTNDSLPQQHVLFFEKP